MSHLGEGERAALHYASSRDLDVGLLLAAGADPFQADSEGNKPLHYAAKDACLDVIVKLLKVLENTIHSKTQNFWSKCNLHIALAYKQLINQVQLPFTLNLTRSQVKSRLVQNSVSSSHKF